MTGASAADKKRGIRIGVNGAGPCVFRHEASEQVLAEDFFSGTPTGPKLAVHGINTERHGSAEYRVHLANVAVPRAVLQAWITKEGH